MLLPAQLWLLLDEREQLFSKVSFQQAVRELRVTHPKHVLVQPWGPPPGLSQLHISEQLQPGVEER